MDNVLLNHYDSQVRPCMDVIDSLRSLGLSKDIQLPTIAVIGDQSSGKSSVLEALSGVALPRGQGIMTRCPLELILVQGNDDDEWKGSLSYREIIVELENAENVETEILKAQNVLAGKNCEISTELIRVRIESKNLPNLTLIDLPGITRVKVGGQPDDIYKQTKTLIYEYIKSKNTVNMVVIPCTSDITTTEALKMALEVDEKGERTIGVLTKADLVDAGMEERICKVLKNNVIPLNKGYMIVRCRKQREVDEKVPLSDVMEIEKSFFQNSSHFREVWNCRQAGINILAEKLTMELLSLIKLSYSALETEINKLLREVTESLKEYNNSPRDKKSQIQFLIEKVQRFSEDIDGLMKGRLPNDVVWKETPHTFLREQFSKWHRRLERKQAELMDEASLRTLALEYIEKCRGQKLPGFVSYEAFEALIRKFVLDLESHAYNLQFEISVKIQHAFVNVALAHFKGRPNLLQLCKELVEKITEQYTKNSGEILAMLFKMESMVYTQDAIYIDGMETEIPPEQSTRKAINSKWELSEIIKHVKTYYKIASHRLADMIPMVLRFYLLLEMGKELQKQMLHAINEEDTGKLLQEDDGTRRRIEHLQNVQEKLQKAKKFLL